MKILLYCSILISVIINLFFSVYAESGDTLTTREINANNNTKKETFIKETDFKKNIKIGETVIINLEKVESQFKETLNTNVEFEWSLKGDTTQIGSIFKKDFQDSGEKTINLNIYTKENNEKKLITSEDISLFVYTNKTQIIFDANIGIEKLDQYKNKSIDEGIFVEEIAIINSKEIEKQNFLEALKKLNYQSGDNSEYIILWGDKEFLSSILSKLNKEREITNSDYMLNIVLVSPFNTDVLESYLKNFLSNKLWITSMLLIPESSVSQIRYNPSDIKGLENDLNKKQYEYIHINTTSQISKILFISQFINTLSNKGFPSTGIFLILLIPFLFTGISILKHLVGLSPIGALIPIGITILFFQIGLLATIIILGTMILLNLILSRVTNKYTLLYTPKISFIIIINMVIMMILINILFQYGLLVSTMSDVIFIILFVVISERLITIILSKEFSEYRFSLINTLLFALIAYGFFSISLFQTIVLAYPELILILIPINFIIGRFTGLRITEYFRFKEVIQNIEE